MCTTCMLGVLRDQMRTSDFWNWSSRWSQDSGSNLPNAATP